MAQNKAETATGAARATLAVARAAVRAAEEMLEQHQAALRAELTDALVHRHMAV